MLAVVLSTWVSASADAVSLPELPRQWVGTYADVGLALPATLDLRAVRSEEGGADDSFQRYAVEGTLVVGGAIYPLTQIVVTAPVTSRSGEWLVRFNHTHLLSMSWIVRPTDDHGWEILQTARDGFRHLLLRSR